MLNLTDRQIDWLYRIIPPAVIIAGFIALAMMGGVNG
jgi:hypothetical protein